MLVKLSQRRKNRKGQGLVEYAFIVAAVAFICLLALSVFGHKLSDQYAIMAGMLPGAHSEDNSPIATQSFLQTAGGEAGPITSTGQVSWQSITGVVQVEGEEEAYMGLVNNVIAKGANTGGAFVYDGHDDDD
jgi:Flp pilus assembly pilin Flp